MSFGYAVTRKVRSSDKSRWWLGTQPTVIAFFLFWCWNFISFATASFMVETQSWVGPSCMGQLHKVTSGQFYGVTPLPAITHPRSPLSPIVLPPLVCIGTQWPCMWPLCFCGFSFKPPSIALLEARVLSRYVLSVRLNFYPGTNLFQSIFKKGIWWSGVHG